MQLRWGILSCGNISGDFVLSMKSLNPDHHKIVAVGATNLDRAKQFALKFDIPKSYGSYLEFAQDKEIDVVYVATKSILHYSAAKLMIENKKSVLIEKPMTIDVETTKQLFELAHKNGVFVMEALFSRFLPSFAIVRDIITSGKIGEVIHIQSNFVMSNLSEGILSKRFGGGVSFAVGVYGLNAIFEAVDYKLEPNVKAIGRTLSKNEKCSGDVTTATLLDFPNTELTATMLLTLRGSNETDLDNLNYTNFIGTKGVLRLNKLNNPSVLELNGEKINVSTDDGQIGYWLDNSHGLRFQCEEVRKCLMEKKLTSDLHGPRETILLIETIRKIMDQIGVPVDATPENFDFEYF